MLLSSPFFVARRRAVVSAACVCCLALGAAAQAQSLKPGLWEHGFAMKTSSGRAEKGMAEMQAQMAKLPPDQRKMMEQMMAQHGVGVGPKGNTVKICLTPEQAKNVDVQVADGDCKQTVTQRGGGIFKFNFVCAGPPPSRGEGEMTLKGDTAYTGKATVDTTSEGKPERVNMDLSGKWVSSDCGNIKPVKR